MCVMMMMMVVGGGVRLAEDRLGSGMGGREWLT
jgi:hypothetical protein